MNLLINFNLKYMRRGNEPICIYMCMFKKFMILQLIQIIPITYTGLSKSAIQLKWCIFCMSHIIKFIYVIILFHFISNEQSGKTPVLIAVIKGHIDVAGFLLESSSDVHEQDNVSMRNLVYLVCCNC